MMRTKTRGFSLIELLIVIAVVAVLVGVAYPTYQENVRKTRRADAKITLESYAARQERRFTENNSYTDDITKIGATSSQDGHYTMSLFIDCDGDSTADSGGTYYCFKLTATATGKQSGDRCATFALDNTGDRTWSGTGGSDDHCW